MAWKETKIELPFSLFLFLNGHSNVAHPRGIQKPGAPALSQGLLELKYLNHPPLLPRHVTGSWIKSKEAGMLTGLLGWCVGVPCGAQPSAAQVSAPQILSSFPMQEASVVPVSYSGLSLFKYFSR